MQKCSCSNISSSGGSIIVNRSHHLMRPANLLSTACSYHADPMKDERDQSREAYPESLLQQVAVELRPAVSGLYRGLWRIAFGRERRSDEEDKQLLASVNAAAKKLGCAGFSSMGAAIFISGTLAMDRLGLEPPDYSSGDLSAGERQERAVEHFALVDAELKRALGELPFLLTCANAEPRFRAELQKSEELRSEAPAGAPVNLRLVGRRKSDRR
jgi:hypothetical protein